MRPTPAGQGDRNQYAAVVERVVARGAVHGIAISPYPDADSVTAVIDRQNRVFVMIGKEGHWTVLKLNQTFAIRPAVALRDLNGDGICELITCGNRIEVHQIANGQLRFAWASEGDLFGSKVSAKVTTGDVNGDGESDIVALNYKPKDENPGHDNLYIFEHIGSKDFQYRLVARKTFTDIHGYHSTGGLAVGRFIGGETDQVAVGNDNGYLWLVDCSGGELTEIQRWKTPRGGAIGPALKSGNLDRDAESELLVGTNGGEIYVLEFDQQGNARIVGSAKAGRLAYGVNAADIEGDGIDEFISSRGRIGYATMTQEDVAVEVWKPAPGKALKRIWSRLTVGNPRTQVHDIDGDGTTEILVYSDYGTGTKIDVLTIQSSPR